MVRAVEEEDEVVGPAAPPGVSAARAAGTAAVSTAAARRAGEGHSRRRAVLAVLASVAFMAQLDLFIVNLAVPAMSRSFHGASLGDLSWVLNAYAIVFAALLVPAGRLADHFGRRRFLLVGVAIFTGASVLCALAPSLAVLVGARALQAVGAATIVPTSLGLLLPAFPARQHGFVVGVWAGVAAVAASSGPPIGGLLVGVDWRWIFLVNAPIGVAVLVAGRLVLPEVKAVAGAQLPHAGSVLAVLGAIALVTLATVEGQQWGWTSGRELLLAAGALAAVVVTVRATLVHEHAVIERALFASRAFTSATLALFVFFLGFATFLLVTVLFFQEAWGYSPVRAGLAIAPAPLVAAVFAVNSGRISARFGRRLTAAVGPLFIVGGALFWLAAAPRLPSYGSGFLPGLLLGGAGAGLSQAPLFASASTLPPDRATTGDAVLNMARQAGSALGVAIAVVLLASAGPTSLAAYQRCWWLVAAGALGASTISVVGGAGVARARRPLAGRGSPHT